MWRGRRRAWRLSPAGANKDTAIYCFHRLHELILANSERVGLLVGEVEQSYFGARRKGKRGHGAAGDGPGCSAF